VRFAGVHPDDPGKGSRVLVELDEPVGKNNGVIDGHVYHEVPEKCGVLCVPRKCSAFEYGAEPDLLPTVRSAEQDENA
jgi:dynactin complex subunit